MLVSVLLELKGPPTEPASCLAAWGATETAVCGCIFLAAASAAAAEVRWSRGRLGMRSGGMLLLPPVLLLALGQAIDMATAAAKMSEHAGFWLHRDPSKFPVQQLILLCCCGALVGYMAFVKGLLRVGTGLSAAAAGAHLHAAFAAGAAAVTAKTCTLEVAAAEHTAAETEAAAGARILLLQLLLLMSCTAAAPKNKAELHDEREEEQQLLLHALRCMVGATSGVAAVKYLYTRISSPLSWGIAFEEFLPHLSLLLLPTKFLASCFSRSAA
ncbi:hypothetical protein, conserved [Eimeria acervulina]|uniref:Uncharacterized protein n=1 Tax=Eimeria acervulina TaxID=5801 RepID=U6GSU3_EIMAC|nr:hypothetical protein, conserved [Eimeria acervulina]CDI82622.1 hypothetical protein, conserved [Eimeria acervulina]